MTLEELKKHLEDNKEAKAYLKQLIDDSVEEATSALKEKNGDIIAANKRFKREKEEALEKLSDAETKLEEAGESDVEAAVEKATKKMQKELDDTKSKLNEKEAAYTKKLIDESLNEALIDNNIDKRHTAAVRALIRSENKIEIDDTDSTAKIGDKTVKEFMQDWSSSDVGKNYVSAGENGGGGAKGSGKPNNGGQQDLMKLSPKERLIAAREQQGD